MTKVNEFYIDPATGAFMDGEDPLAVTTPYDDHPALPSEDDLAAYAEVPCDIATVVDASVPAEPVQPTVAELPPIVWVGMRDMVTALDNEFEVTFDMSLNVEVRHPSTQAILDAGVVTKRVRIAKASLATELQNRTAATPVTEAVLETMVKEVAKTVVKEGSTDAAKQSLKRLRELAGIPGKGNWV